MGSNIAHFGRTMKVLESIQRQFGIVPETPEAFSRFPEHISVDFNGFLLVCLGQVLLPCLATGCFQMFSRGF